MEMIQGLTIAVTVESYELDMLRNITEQSARNAFAFKYGFPATDLAWHYEAASTWEDPDTGETYELDERWVLMVEGTSPSVVG